MSLMANYPFGFSNGVSIQGLPVLNTYPGRVYWVYNGSALAPQGIGGSNSNDGSFDKPFSTIDYAVSRCTANRGDIVMVKAGHSENIAASDIGLDVAGVAVVGLGSGSDRPTIKFTGTTDTTKFDMSANNTKLINFRFIMDDNTGVDRCVLLNGTGCEIAYCEFTADADDFYDTAIVVGAADADSDGSWIHHNVFRSIAAGANSAISIAFDHAFLRIEDNYIDGDWADAGIDIPTAGNACTELLIARNYIRNRQTGDHAIQIDTGGTMSGAILDNRLVADTVTAIMEPHTLETLGNIAHLGGTNLESFPIPIPANFRMVTRKTIAAAGTSFTTGASPVTIFTVTGSVMARVYATIGTALASTLNNGTLAVGVSGATTAFIGTTTADGTNFANNTVWAGDTSPTVAAEVLSNSALNWVLVTNGSDIIVTVATNSMTAGTMEIYCEWYPLTAGASVVAA